MSVTIKAPRRKCEPNILPHETLAQADLAPQPTAAAAAQPARTNRSATRARRSPGRRPGARLPRLPACSGDDTVSADGGAARLCSGRTEKSCVCSQTPQLRPAGGASRPGEEPVRMADRRCWRRRPSAIRPARARGGVRLDRSSVTARATCRTVGRRTRRYTCLRRGMHAVRASLGSGYSSWTLYRICEYPGGCPGDAVTCPLPPSRNNT